MKLCSVLIAAAVLACFASVSDGSKILAIFPLPGYSHWIFFRPLLRTLAEKGHEVTVLGHFPQSPPIPGYKDILLDPLPSDKEIGNLTYDFVKSFGVAGGTTFLWERAGWQLCDYLYNTTQAKALATSNEKYDLLITEAFGTDCCLPFAQRFGAPTIGMISCVPMPWTSESMDLPDNPTYVPTFLLPVTKSFTFQQRLLNVILQFLTKVGYRIKSRAPSEDIVKRLFPNSPPLIEHASNMSLLIANSHFSVSGSRPGIPALVEAGGMHIEPGKPLPKDIAEILDNAKEGVVYFSLGSMMRPETFPPAKINAILNALGAIPHKVLWKGQEEGLPKPLPKNLITKKWLPQRDVLCHPNVIAFITHGGLMGTQEGVYCGVPMIGLPLFGDQELNIGTYVALDIAVKVRTAEIEENFAAALNKVITTPSYLKNAKQMSALFQDRPHTPLETAVYWTEYVLRHRGAPHLRTGARHLSWYQLYMLDIIALLAGIVLGFVLLVRFLCKKAFGKKQVQSRHKKKTN